MTSIHPRATVLLRRLVDWYDHDDADDDELERIVSEARDLLQQSEPSEPEDESSTTTTGKYVLYDFDQGELFSTDVYASYADAKPDAEGLNNVLILKLPIPVIESEASEIMDDDPRCDCELPGFFCCGVPGILAHLEQGRVAPGTKVERCDLCQRYESDEAARQKLKELGVCD